MSEPYNIFISWSGEGSKWVASALHDWLPLVIQAAKPWMSATEIEKGSRGLNEVSAGLEGMKVGIVCLTPENINAPWILYEAGALSKTIDDKTRLCTYLLGGLQFQDVTPPLGMFQATKANKEETQDLVSSINNAVSKVPIPRENLEKIFDKMWPDLEKKLAEMPKSGQAAKKRSVEDIVTEILEITRGQAQPSQKSIQVELSRLHDLIAYGTRQPGTRPLVWTYEIRDANDKYVTAHGPYGSEDEALEAGRTESKKLVEGGKLEGSGFGTVVARKRVWT